MNDKTLRTVRTVIQVVLAIALTVPFLVAQLPITWQETPWLVSIVAAAAVVARLMQSDTVDKLLALLGVGKDSADPTK